MIMQYKKGGAVMFGDEMFDHNKDGQLNWSERAERDYWINELTGEDSWNGGASSGTGASRRRSSSTGDMSPIRSRDLKQEKEHSGGAFWIVLCVFLIVTSPLTGSLASFVIGSILLGIQLMSY